MFRALAFFGLYRIVCEARSLKRGVSASSEKASCRNGAVSPDPKVPSCLMALPHGSLRRLEGLAGADARKRIGLLIFSFFNHVGIRSGVQTLPAVSLVTRKICSSANLRSTPARGFADAKHRCACHKSTKPPAGGGICVFCDPTGIRSHIKSCWIFARPRLGPVGPAPFESASQASRRYEKPRPKPEFFDRVTLRGFEPRFVP
jgi:hypothetical protein